MNGVLRDDISPVFICGYPKSGTTLLLALLDRHPELLAFPEESKFLKQVMGRPERQKNLDYILTQTGPNVFRFGEIRLPSGYRDYSSIDFEEYEKSLREHWNQTDGTERALLESVVFSYGEITGQIDKRYWVEKTPGNEHHLKDAVRLWPELRAIYIVRDPRDNYCSYRIQSERDSRTLMLGDFIAGWRKSIHAWKRFADRNENCLLIRYEDLVQYPRTVMQRVCDFLQIGWNDILLKPTRNGVFWSGNSMYDKEFKGVSTASLGRYLDLLTPDEIDFLETWLGCVMVRYGWQLETSSPRRILNMLVSLLRIHSPLTRKMLFICYREYLR